jgi:hypothetical protein
MLHSLNWWLGICHDTRAMPGLGLGQSRSERTAGSEVLLLLLSPQGFVDLLVQGSDLELHSQHKYQKEHDEDQCQGIHGKPPPVGFVALDGICAQVFPALGTYSGRRQIDLGL